MNPAEMLGECQKLLNDARVRRWPFNPRWSIALDRRDKIQPQLHEHYEHLAKEGHITWGAIVQANSAIYASGEIDLPGGIIYSPGSYFHDQPAHLHDIAARVWRLKGRQFEDNDLTNLGDTLANELYYPTKVRIPNRLADDHEVYLTTIHFHRSRLPGGMVSAGVFPIVIHAPHTPVTMVLPLPFWSSGLTANWSNLESVHAPKPRRRGRADPSPPVPKPPKPNDNITAADQAKRDKPIRLSDRCVQQLRSVIQQNRLKGQFFVKVGATGNAGSLIYSMDLATDVDPAEYVVFESSGFTIALLRAVAPRMTGTIVDYQDNLMGGGFTFHNPNED